MKPWHLRVGGYIAVAVAMCVLIFRLPIALFFVAGLVVLACSLGGWALSREQRRPGAQG
jgi:hypothetical protein